MGYEISASQVQYNLQITRKRTNKTEASYTLEGRILENVDSIKYLGVTITQDLILAYSWARPAILVAGKGRGGNIFISSVSSLSFLFLFLPCPPLSSPLLSLLSLFSLSLGDDTK